MVNTIVAFGDCNTLGAGDFFHKSYPELLGEHYRCEVINRGFTMATTREGISLSQDTFPVTGDVLVLIQFGLVDSHKTFKYAPYVAYYPETFLRKKYRGVIKKYKKICRRSGLCKVFGEVNVVEREEYSRNIRALVTLFRKYKTCLLETVPNHDTSRNKEIQKYNGELRQIADDYPEVTLVPLYDHFSKNMETFYSDTTHCNDEGYTYIAQQIIQKMKVAK